MLRIIATVTIGLLLVGCGGRDPVWDRAIGYWGSNHQESVIGDKLYEWYVQKVRFSADGTGGWWEHNELKESLFTWSKSKVDDATYRVALHYDDGRAHVLFVQPLAIDSLRLLTEAKQELFVMQPIKASEFADAATVLAEREAATKLRARIAEEELELARQRQLAEDTEMTEQQMAYLDEHIRSHAIKTQKSPAPEAMEKSALAVAVIENDGSQLDAWRTPFRFQAIDKLAWQLSSAGADGKFETLDDIVLESHLTDADIKAARTGFWFTNKKTTNDASLVISKLAESPNDEDGNRAISSFRDAYGMPLRYQRFEGGSWQVICLGHDMTLDTDDDIIVSGGFK